MITEFARNLRLLCGYRPSITAVGQDLGVHRSQLARYLAGGAMPRAALLRRMGDYFGVEQHELMMPHDEFAAIVRLRGIASDTLTRTLRVHVDRIIRRNDPRIQLLEGTFFEYHFSMSTPGMVIRSLLAFETQGDHMTYRRFDRIGPPGRSCRRHYRYLGISVMTGDRVFMNDYEAGTGIEQTQTVLNPDYAHRWNRLHGIKLGVAANRGHMPCAVRVLLERTPARSLPRTNFRRCGIIPPDHPDLPPHVVAMIENRTSGPHVFSAWES